MVAYPNPASSEFKIDVLENEELEIIVFKEESKKPLTTLNYCIESIDVSQWERGSYILHIYHREKLVKTERLILM